MLKKLKVTETNAQGASVVKSVPACVWQPSDDELQKYQKPNGVRISAKVEHSNETYSYAAAFAARDGVVTRSASARAAAAAAGGAAPPDASYVAEEAVEGRMMHGRDVYTLLESVIQKLSGSHPDAHLRRDLNQLRALLNITEVEPPEQEEGTRMPKHNAKFKPIRESTPYSKVSALALTLPPTLSAPRR